MRPKLGLTGIRTQVYGYHTGEFEPVSPVHNTYSLILVVLDFTPPPPPLRHSFLLFSSFDIAMATTTTTTTTATRKFGGVLGARVMRAPQSRRLSLVRAADDGDSKATTTTTTSSSSFDVVDSERIKAERCVPHSAHFFLCRLFPHSVSFYIYAPHIIHHPPIYPTHTTNTNATQSTERIRLHGGGALGGWRRASRRSANGYHYGCSQPGHGPWLLGCGVCARRAWGVDAATSARGAWAVKKTTRTQAKPAFPFSLLFDVSVFFFFFHFLFCLNNNTGKK